MIAEEAKVLAAICADDIRITAEDRTLAIHLMSLALGVGLTRDESTILMAERVSRWRRDLLGWS